MAGKPASEQEQVRHDYLLQTNEQYWLQIRHVDDLRNAFTNFYALIVAGLLALTAQGSLVSHWSVYVGIAALSIFGLLLNWRASEVVTEFERRIVSIAELLGTANVVPDISTQKGRWRGFRKLYVSLYVVSSAVFLGLSLYAIVEKYR